MATFLRYGPDILANANFNANGSRGGQDRAGQITVSGDSSPFPDDYIVELKVNSVPHDGEFDGSTALPTVPPSALTPKP